MNPNAPQHQINLDTLVQIKKADGRGIRTTAQHLSYIEQTGQLIAAMPKLLEQQQYVQLQRHAHCVKSGSLNLGAEPLSDMTIKLETLSKQVCNEMIRISIRPGCKIELHRLSRNTRLPNYNVKNTAKFVCYI